MALKTLGGKLLLVDGKLAQCDEDCCLVGCEGLCGGFPNICGWEIDTPHGTFTFNFDAVDVFWYDITGTLPTEYNVHPLTEGGGHPSPEDWTLCYLGVLPEVPEVTAGVPVWNSGYLETVTSSYSQVLTGCNTRTYAGSVQDRYRVEIVNTGPSFAGPLVAIHYNATSGNWVVSIQPRTAIQAYNYPIPSAFTINGTVFTTSFISFNEGDVNRVPYNQWALSAEITNCAGLFGDLSCDPDPATIATIKTAVWNTGTRDFTFESVISCTGNLYDANATDIRFRIEDAPRGLEFRNRFTLYDSPPIDFRLIACPP